MQGLEFGFEFLADGGDAVEEAAAEVARVGFEEGRHEQALEGLQEYASRVDQVLTLEVTTQERNRRGVVVILRILESPPVDLFLLLQRGTEHLKLQNGADRL